MLCVDDGAGTNFAMAGLTSPKQKFDALEGDEKHCLTLLRNLVFDSNKEKVRRLYNKLDRDGSGVLDEDDFKHDIAYAQQHLQTLYRLILENFDFDDNQSIEYHEFFDGFILLAWLENPALYGK